MAGENTPFGFGTSQVPFGQRVFEPGRIPILGLIGRFAGVPTAEERGALQTQEANRQFGQALSPVAADIAAGTPPQAAVMNWLSTPEGVEAFTTGGPDILEDLERLVTLGTGPTLSPGNVEFGANRQPLARAPTMEAQEILDLSRMAGEDPAVAASAALANVTSGDMGLKERGIRFLLETGQIDDTGAAWLAAGEGVQSFPITNRAGDVIGHQFVQSGTGAPGPFVSTRRVPQVAQTRQPGFQLGLTPEATGGATALPGFEQPRGAPGAEITERAGLAGVGEVLLGGIFGQIDSRLSAPEVSAYEQAINDIKLSARAVREGSRLLADEVQRIDDIVDNCGIGSNAVQCASGLIQWHELLNREAALIQGVLNDPESTEEEVQDARNRLRALERAKAPLPDLQSLIVGRERAMEAGVGPAIAALGQAGRRGIEILGDIPSFLGDILDETFGSGDEEIPTFASEAEANEAFRAGRIRVGQEIQIGGRRMRVQE